MKFWCIFGFLFIALVTHNEAENILFLSTVPSPSHYIFNKALAEGLVARGHNITFVSPDVDKSYENFHYIHLEKSYENYYNDSEHMELYDMAKEPPLKSIFTFYTFYEVTCGGVAASKGVEVIKNYPDNFKFHLVVNDFTCGPCMLPLLQKFKYPPLIQISPFCNPVNTLDFAGGDKLGLTVKPFFMLDYDVNMNIFQRLYNGLINFLDTFYRVYFVMPSYEKQMKAIFGPNIPSSDFLDKQGSLFFVNSHPAVDFPEQLPPNVIEIGGLQIKDPKPVPDDIDQFMRKGKKGAILMALGTNMRSDEIGQDAIDQIVEAFRLLPDYNFVWKFETAEMLKNIPTNLMIKAWLPQNDILAHPSIKAFITHGGMLSIHEATWHGVPVVCIPFVADQHRNAHKSVRAGVAIKLNIFTLTTEKLKKAIVELTHNPRYQKNMQLRSKRFRDQPQKPLERAVWWSEYLMRNQKPTHLRPAEFSLGLLGQQFWDMQVIILGVLFGVFMVLRRVVKKVFSSKRKIDENKKKL